jgi:hypothetical protein
LNESGLEARLLSEVGVECVSDLPFVGLGLGERGVRPTVVGGTVRAVEVLPSGSVECVALLVGNGEFHGGGSTPLYTSEGIRRD